MWCPNSLVTGPSPRNFGYREMAPTGLAGYRDCWLQKLLNPPLGRKKAVFIWTYPYKEMVQFTQFGQLQWVYAELGNHQEPVTVHCFTYNWCWEKWEVLGLSPKVVPTLREGYTLPFRFRPNLTRSPTVISNYHNPAKQSFLLEALYQLVNKNTVQPVEIKLTGQPAIFGTRAQQPVETCPGPEHLEHLFEHRDVQDGNPRDHKNLPPSRGVGHIHRFQRSILPHTNSQSVQEVHALLPPGSVLPVQALPFGLSTAPMEFTVVAKEVKLVAFQKGIRIHQYLDDWLVRASTHHTCLQHTQTLVTLYQELGWLVNMEKLELVPKQVFNFVGYQFDLKEGKVRPTEERWQALTHKIRSILSDPLCPVRQFMSLIGLLTATEKQVHLGRLTWDPYSGTWKTTGGYQSHWKRWSRSPNPSTPI